MRALACVLALACHAPPPSLPPMSILVEGDSNSIGCVPAVDFCGWPEYLGDAFNVEHRARGGSTARDALDRWEPLEQEHDAAVVMFGSAEAPQEVHPTEYRDALFEMLDLLPMPVVLLTPPPSIVAGTQQRLDVYQWIVLAICDLRAGVSCVDVHSMIDVAADLPDGMHFSAAAAQRVADAVRAELRRLGGPDAE